MCKSSLNVQKKTIGLPTRAEKTWYEEALRLQEQLDGRRKTKIARVHKEASTHMGSHTLQQLRGYSFNEIKVLFEATVKRVNTFTLMESDDTVPKVVAGSSKRSAEEKLIDENVKRQKTGEASDKDDTLWKLQRYMHDPLEWRLYDTCGVHHVSTLGGHVIFMLVEKDYPLTRGLMTLMLCNKLKVDHYSDMVNHKFRGGLLGIKGFYKVYTAGSTYYCQEKT
ncbi:hypothetical protein Tco_1092306 [Tanacetum coccineum]|uniref:Uncharacterized protein n=1 Tax=Tanacetum coccineum TaxID=301880 RepID=A0ABQ5IBP3_9ASTR